MKMALKCKNDALFVIPLKNVLRVMDPINHPRTPKLLAIAYENNHKHKNNEHFIMPLKHVQSVLDLVNQLRTPKLWAIAHKNGHKCKNDEFFVIPHLWFTRSTVLGFWVDLQGP
jgi:hypothetical protein